MKIFFSLFQLAFFSVTSVEEKKDKKLLPTFFVLATEVSYILIVKLLNK
jgi:hypothetical protein